MVYNRQPRIQQPRPGGTVKLPDAPAIPAKQESSPWISVGLPLAGIVIMVVAMLIFSQTSGSINWQMLMFTPIMLIGTLSGFLLTRSQKKKVQKEIETSRERFRQELSQADQELSGMKQAEETIRKTTDPSLEECLQRARSRDPRLGERRPEDADFLNLRLGLGKALVNFNIEKPQRQPNEEFEKELDFVDLLHKKYSRIDNAPILARFTQSGSAGISGRRVDVLETARALIVQACTHHWFDEVKIAVAVTPDSMAEWSWVSLLPHYHNRFQVDKVEKQDFGNLPFTSLLTRLEDELHKREQSVIAQKAVHSDGQQPGSLVPLPRLMIVFDYLPLGFSHPAIQLLLEKGKSLGVHGIFLTDMETHIPGECGISIKREVGAIRYNEIGARGYHRECNPDSFPRAEAEQFAKALALVPWPKHEQKFQAPETITFLEMFGKNRVEELPVRDWWNGKSPYGYMRAPIGAISATSNLIFDLNETDEAHGPHGLLGGMTGSGKSEVLKAIILSLAVTNHPYDLNFALIDFKGGAAFNELRKLPHTVGVMTDIESNATYAERVIHSLEGELIRRKVVIEEAREAFHFDRAHIDDYRKVPVRKPLPRLVIIFDEFAEFKQRNPESSKKLISISRQGRSLGVHLILATQNISAAVDPEIMQNSKFKICLKVAEPQDSMQMVGIPDAINLTRGRGYFAANNRLLFQSGYSGASYEVADKRTEPAKADSKLPFAFKPLMQTSIESKDRATFSGKTTQATAVINYINDEFEKLGLKKPPPVWAEPLSERLYLPDVLSKAIYGGWNRETWEPVHEWEASQKGTGDLILPIFGLLDQPKMQKQVPIQLNEEQGGNLMVFGSAGSGKSTLLRSIVTSLALTYSPRKVQAYILDYGGQSMLKALEAFPHVGAVVTRLEAERTERLIQLIRTEVNRRNNSMRDLRVDNWLDHNAKCGKVEQFPALFLIIDNFRDFKQSFESEFISDVTRLISGAQASGLFLVIASSLQSDIPNELFSNINQRVTFIQADKSEYFRLVGSPTDAKLAEDASKGLRPGRGLSKGEPPEEFQTALPCYGENDKEQTENLIELAEDMHAKWKSELPKPVKTLPYLATQPPETLHPGDNNFVSPIGLDFVSLQPVGMSLLNDGPTFLIGGVTRQCGKTTLLRTWLLGLAKMYTKSQLEVVIIDFHARTLTSLRHLPTVKSYVGNKLGLDEVLDTLLAEVERRQGETEQIYMSDPDNFDIKNVLALWAHILVVIDDYDRFSQSMGGPAEKLVDLVQRGQDCGISFIITGKLTDLPNSYIDKFIDRVKKSGCGVLLGGTEGIDEYNNTRRPTGSVPMGLPAGRGYIISRGQANMIQALAYWNENENPEDALRRWLKALKPATSTPTAIEQLESETTSDSD